MLVYQRVEKQNPTRIVMSSFSIFSSVLYKYIKILHMHMEVEVIDLADFPAGNPDSGTCSETVGTSLTLAKKQSKNNGRCVGKWKVTLYRKNSSLSWWRGANKKTTYISANFQGKAMCFFGKSLLASILAQPLYLYGSPPSTWEPATVINPCWLQTARAKLPSYNTIMLRHRFFGSHPGILIYHYCIIIHVGKPMPWTYNTNDTLW